MHPESPSDPPYALMEYAGGQLAYTTEGEGDRVLVAIPGLPGTVRDFRWLGAALGEEFRLIRVDLPGFGRSTRTGYAGMSIGERAEAVRALIEALDLGSVTLVTHSSGGTVAGHLARYHPALVERCVLIACPGPRPHYPAALYRATAAVFSRRPGRLLMVPVQRALYRALGFSKSLSDAERMYTTLDAAAAHFDTHSENVRNMTQPTLTAWAQDDRMIPSDIFLALDAIAPDGPRLRFDTGGHNIQKTRATELAEAIRALTS